MTVWFIIGEMREGSKRNTVTAPWPSTVECSGLPTAMSGARKLSKFPIEVTPEPKLSGAVVGGRIVEESKLPSGLRKSSTTRPEFRVLCAWRVCALPGAPTARSSTPSSSMSPTTAKS